MQFDSSPFNTSDGEQSLLQLANITKSFGDTEVLHGVSFDVDAGEIVCLLGPSGCGKTTLLRIVAGLEMADSGRVVFAGQDLAGVPVHQRGFGLMFQDFALFPHKDVIENVAFGLRMAGKAKTEIEQRVAEMLDLVDLTGYERRRVYELSGGQQQRVALARSLAPSPRLLMLDEPLGSLDRTLREGLLLEVRRILKRIGVTALYVTHDQQEAFTVADQVIILNAGRIEQQGSPLQVYRRPANAFVARFLGMQNLLPGQVLRAEPALVATSLGALARQDCREGLAAGDAVTVLLRPDSARLLSTGEDVPAENVVHGELAGVSFRGSQLQVRVRHGIDTTLVFDLPGGVADELPAPGQPVRLTLDPAGISLLGKGEESQPISAPTVETVGNV